MSVGRHHDQPEVRLVPMTRRQRDRLNRGHCLGPEGEVLTALELVAAWDAAPADPAEAVAEALHAEMLRRYPNLQEGDPETTMRILREEATAVLRALGWRENPHG